ncbi:MAG: OmpH family outer membrane protein [Candidatus Omnitrophota bacterium]
MSRKGFAFLFAAIFLLGSAALVSAADLKIGYIDLDKTFEEYNKTKDVYESLDAKLKGKEKERKGMVDGIRKLKDEIELLSDKGREEKQVAIDEKISQLGEFDRKTKDEFRRERMKAIRDISGEIDVILQDYGKKNGYDLIVSSRALVYGKSGMDITAEIIGLLNKQ